MATNEQAPWGRVGDDGTVYVREADGERAVGQYPDATPEEALAYFERKFTELAGQVGLLEQRARGGAPAADVAKAITHLAETVSTANAVGDLAALSERLEKLGGSVGELTEKQSAEAKAAAAEALVQREALVAEAETLAAQDPAKAQWKQVTAQLDGLFARWQTEQKDGPRLPEEREQRALEAFPRRAHDHRRPPQGVLRRARRRSQGGAHRKQELVERAEALSERAPPASPTTGRLLDDWKPAGRAGKHADDALWERFKAAGDILYAAKAEIDAKENEEFAGNLTEKLALLDEAEKLLTETDREKAKSSLLGIQRKWDAIGKVPRDSIRTVEDRLRKVETHVRKLDEDHWNKSDPEKVARSEGMASQLTAAIEKLERELDEAKAKGDARKIKDAEEALAARRVWLDALGS